MRPAESSVVPLPTPLDGAATQVFGPADSGSPQAPHRPNPHWPRVPGYEILAEIGSGGMGIVYQARHRGLRRTVALKMLRGGALADPDVHRRFQAEAEAVARLQHPNIIQVFEVGRVEPRDGEAHPTPFIALEFVDGGSLSRHTDRPQPPRQAAALVEKLAHAVHSAHRLGVVHRDLKPANVLLTPGGEPKIADFGVAKQLANERDAGGHFVTQAGLVLGTPEYMAPEQAACEAPTPAIDIYALGVILYELLTGRVPFQGETAVATLALTRHQEPVPPRGIQPGVPRDLETICLKCLEKEPGNRYGSAAALADDLRRFLDGRTIQARRVSELERVTRWCRRNPLAAGSLAGTVGIFLTAFFLVVRSHWQMEAALYQEARHRHEAERKEKAERWERYRADIVATASALQVHDTGGARRTLEDTPEEYRNWEWRHFRSRVDLARHVLRTDDAVITEATLTPARTRVALFGDGGFARVWDLADRQVVRTFRQSPELYLATLSPDGKTFASTTREYTVNLRDVDTGHLHATLRGHTADVHSPRFTADGGRLVTGSQDRTVRVWDAATGQALRVFRPPSSGTFSVHVSPDGRRVVTADHDLRRVRLWVLDTGEAVATLAGHEQGLRGVEFNRHGDKLVTVGNFPGNELRLWDGMSGRLIAVLGRHDNAVTQVAFSPDGKRIATSAMDQTIRLWDGATGAAVATLRGHNGWVNCVDFSPDGTRLASGSQDHTVRLWDAADGTPRAVLNGHTAAVKAVGYAADGGRLVSAAADGTVRLWDARTADNNGVLRGHTTFVYAVAFHPDGQRVASAGWDGTVRLWDATTGRQQSVLKHGAGALITSVAVHPAGRVLAARVRGSIVLWDLTTGREVRRWAAPSHIWQDTRLTFSPRGDLLASGGRDGEVRLWDVNRRAEAAVLRGHRATVRDVAFSPDGRWLASAAEVGDRTIRVWDVARREAIAVLEGHANCVYAVAFSPDGTLLASGSIDGTVRLWDTATWREAAVLKHGTNVYGVAFTPDGTRLACACADNSIRFWDVPTRQSVAVLRGHTDYVHGIAFSPDGTRLASASGDCTVRVWDTVRPQDRAQGQ